MNIVVDENVPNRTIEALRTLGHVVTDVKLTVVRGEADEGVWALARRERALLISTDKGFAALWDTQHDGILIVRLHQPNGERIHERVMLAIGNVPPAEWPGLTLVMRDLVQTTRRAREQP